MIDTFDPEKSNDKEATEDMFTRLFQNQDAEFSYYQNCFTLTLRNGDWKKIPNNTLAEGDVIKLLPEDKAPALIGLITYEEEIN